jgi:hypothetical protein
MAIHPRRVAGIIFVKIDGDQIAAKGSFEYKLSGFKNESIPNANASLGIGGAWSGGYIKGTIANYNETDHRAIKEAEGVTVTLELGNGKVIVAKDAFQTDEAVGSVENGEIPIQFDSENVEEIR